MKKLDLLLTWTKVLFIICMLVLIFAPGFFLISIIKPDLVPNDLRYDEIVNIKLSGVLIVLSLYAGQCLFVYSLYLFRKLLHLFRKRHFFVDEVITHLAKIGKFILLGAIVRYLPQNVYYIFTQDGFTLDLVEFWDIVFVFSLSLFFSVLSEVFKKAKEMKEENELTV